MVIRRLYKSTRSLGSTRETSLRGLAGSGPGQAVGAGCRKLALMGGIVLVFSVLDGLVGGVVVSRRRC